MSTSRPKRLGNFDILARIAKGGMAEIFLARQRGMVGFSRLVVIKRILPHLAEESRFVEMFLQEAGLAARIAHPNVVQIFDVGHHGDDYYIAMEFISGPSVATILRLAVKRGELLPPLVVAEVVAQACDGLHAAHELRNDQGQPLGLVHRDISPQNLMVCENGVVKLVDFGIAKAESSTIRTHTGNIKGKYPYMSPEQCTGKPLDRRTDVFSLGIVFFEMLAGKRLFKRQTDLMTLKAITEEPLPTPGELREGVTHEFNGVILRALTRPREERFATAEEMGAAVRQVMERLGTPSSPRLLAGYLQRDCAELLAARQAAIRKLSRSADAIPSLLQLDVEPGSDEAYSFTPAGEGPRARDLRRTQRRRALLRPALISLVVVLLAALGGLAYRWLSPTQSAPGGAATDARAEPRPPGPAVRFGFPTSFSRSVWEREMPPLLRYLERRVGRRVELAVPENYDSLRAQMFSGEIGLAYLPPLQYVEARAQDPGIQVLATPSFEGATSYQGYIIARHDSVYTTVEQLQGSRFCYVDRGSASGYLFPRYFIRRRGLDPDSVFGETRFSGTHVAVMRDVIAGRCDAGAVYSGALFGAAEHNVASSKLRMVVVTGQIPYDAVCASPELPAILAARFKAALLGFVAREQVGRPVLGQAVRITRFVETRKEAYDLVEKSARAEGMIPAEK